jgi:hypothetical protein
MNVAVSAMLLSALCAGELRAQSKDSIRVGDRIRLELQTGERIMGRAIGHEPDSIRLLLGQPPAQPRAFPTSNIRSYSISRGRNRGRGAKRGALVGGIAGATLVGFAIHSDLTAEEVFVPATVIFAPVGIIITGLGAVIGAIAAPRRWSEPVILQALSNDSQRPR